MSSPLSVRDVLDLIDLAPKTYKRLKNAPEELGAAKIGVEKIQKILTVLNRTLDDKTSFLAQDLEMRVQSQD